MEFVVFGNWVVGLGIIQRDMYLRIRWPVDLVVLFCSCDKRPVYGALIDYCRSTFVVILCTFDRVASYTACLVNLFAWNDWCSSGCFLSGVGLRTEIDRVVEKYWCCGSQLAFISSAGELVDLIAGVLMVLAFGREFPRWLMAAEGLSI